MSGSGSIIGEGNWNLDDLDMSVTGSGDVSLSVDCDDLSARISGSGEIGLDGTAQTLDLTITGSGDFEGLNL